MSAAESLLAGVGPADIAIHPPARARMPGAPGARSHLADGRVVSWSPRLPPGVQVAVDAEIADQSVPRALARRFGTDRPDMFWPQWTAVEVACKVLDVPIMVWLSVRGLQGDPDRVLTATFVAGDLVVSVGVAALLAPTA
jgi:hypothetical protein